MKKSKHYLQLTKKWIPGFKLVPSLPIHIKDRTDEDYQHTIMDIRLREQNGWIQIPEGTLDLWKIPHQLRRSRDRQKILDYANEHNCKFGEDRGIIVPCGEVLKVLPNGDIRLERYAIEAYRVLAALENLDRVIRNDWDFGKASLEIERAVLMYKSAVASAIVGKSGLLRKTLYPRQELSAYGVVVNRVDLAEDEVAVPIRTLKNWLKNDEYRKVLRVDDTYIFEQNSKIINYFKNERVLVVGMPDHDFNCTIACRVVPWTENAIGMHPKTVAMMGRDFDGDLIYIKAFKTKTARKDLELFTVKAHGKSPYKMMTKYTSTNHMDAMKTEGVDEAQFQRYQKLLVGMDPNELSKQNSTSASDFQEVKFGTANAGDIGNILRVVGPIFNGSQDLSNDIYHIVAQKSLDAKHGTKGVVSVLSDLLRNEDGWTLKHFLKVLHSLECFNKDHIKYIVHVMYQKYDDGYRWRGSIMTVHSLYSPYGNCIRNKVLDPGMFTEMESNDPLVHFMQLTN